MFEFLFKYSQAAFDDSSFIFTRDWPLWLMPCAAALFAISLAIIFLSKRHALDGMQRLCIGLLQTLMVALVLFILWQPALVTERLVNGENAVAVMLDTSASMALMENGEPRMTEAQALLTPNALAELNSSYSVLPYSFSESAELLDTFSVLPQPGQGSRLGQSILQTLRQSGSTSLGAVVLISDGADNSGTINQAELNEIISFGVPIHSVGIGQETIPEDLELKEVLLPEKALPGTKLSARVSIQHDQAGTARLKVYNGDTFLSSHDIVLNPQQNITIAYVDIEASDPGQLDLRFSLDPMTDERNLGNNTRSQVIDVAENQYKILYIEGEPRWEYKFLQRALDDEPNIQLSTLLRVTPNKYYRQGIDSPEQLQDGFPTEKTELYAYDALIIGSVEVSEFSAAQQTLIRDFVSERGGSLMMIAGLHGLGLGGWSESVVNEILPSRLSSDNSEFTRLKAPVILTSSGAAAPMLQFSDDKAENSLQWSELPELADYQNIGPLRPAATTLLELVNIEGNPQPLLVTQPYGRGQSYILATGGTWRWQMSLPVEDMRHETFWRQLARALVANAPPPFELSSRIEDETIKVRAQIRDPDAEQNQGIAIDVVASSSNDAPITFELLPVAGQPGIYEASFTPEENSLYSIEAISSIDNNPVNSTRTAIRYHDNQEAFDVRQNRALLERLSTATNGQYWTPEQWSEIPDAISYSTAGITAQDIRYLWDAPIFFILLLALKAIEWLLRRRWRVI